MNASNMSTQQSQNAQNPFHVGSPVPPEQFIGRKFEIDTAFDQILSRSHLAIYGLDGMGKSSLLNYLASLQAWQERGRESEYSKAVIVYLNCTVIVRFTPTKFWRKILRKISRIVEDRPIKDLIASIVKKDEIDWSDLEQVLREIGKQHKFLLLLLDEYGAALYPNAKYTETEMLDFLGSFRNLAVHCEEGKNLSTIVVSSRPLNQLGPKFKISGSPWFNHYLFQPLKPFKKNEANTLLSRMPEQWMLTEKQKKTLREVSDGHPQLLQNACFLLYNNFRSERDPFENDFRDDFLAATQHLVRTTWNFLTLEEHLLLMLITLLRLGGALPQGSQFNTTEIEKILSQRERDLFDLETMGILAHQTEQEQDKKVYYFNSQIMEWWVTQEILLQRNKPELQKLERTAIGLSRKQIAQIRELTKWLWQNQALVKPTVEWFGKLVAAFA